MFRLNPALDRRSLRSAFQSAGRVEIADFLAPESAAALHGALTERTDWKLIVNSGDKVFDLDRTTLANMPPEQLEALDQAVFAGAREGFQFRYHAIRVPDQAEERRLSGDILSQFALWLSTGEVRDLLRFVIGTEAVDYADAQATAYGAGDFLTAHDDEVPGKNRLAAYVLGLTPTWRIEWGGLLLFHGADGHVERGLSPRFNRLNLFAVPQVHSVSMVTKAAPSRRYAITGWLRFR